MIAFINKLINDKWGMNCKKNIICLVTDKLYQ